MKRFFYCLSLLLLSVFVYAQQRPALDQLKDDPRKAYGNDYPYSYQEHKLTPSPKGYKPFYISHYGRHGSRYYWNEKLYDELDTLLTEASRRNILTQEGAAFYTRFMDAKQELQTGVSELTQLGWEQHQFIARTMYNNFKPVFSKGGNVMAISSLSGRCVISMSAFCQELVQCNPKLEIREQSSRFTLDGVVPQDSQNPVKHDYPKATPRYEANRSSFPSDTLFAERILKRVFTDISAYSADKDHIAQNLVNLYTSLPSIDHVGMMGGILTDDDISARWEQSNLGSYSWVFSGQYEMIPILEDIIAKADDAISGRSDRLADLRFGHDSCIGPLTVLMGINGADLDPEDPYAVKECYQNWETCKASNLQLVFYKGKKGDILVKCLLNGAEASLPVPTDNFPYYDWEQFKSFYNARCSSVK